MADSEGSGFSGKVATFKQFLWNPQTKEVAGRTGRSWAEITVFFVVLYACLAGFWLGLLYLVQLRLPAVEDGPLYNDYLSHRGPGVHLVPNPDVVGRDKQKIFLMDNIEDYFQQVELFLQNRTGNEDLGDCSVDKFRSQWDSKSFCLYIYLNAVHKFVPLPEEPLGDVKIECRPSKEKYDEFMESADYYPASGFDQSKFPWTLGQEWDKEAPLVAAKVAFTDKLVEGNEGRVNCRVLARNIFLDLEKPNIGMVDFRVRAPKRVEP